MAFDTTGLGKRDAKIVNDNPGASAYELLELGLSEKGFEKLSAQNPDSKEKTASIKSNDNGAVGDQSATSGEEGQEPNSDEPGEGAVGDQSATSEQVTQSNDTSGKASNILSRETETIVSTPKATEAPSNKITQKKAVAIHKVTGKRTPMSAYSARLLSPSEFDIELIN